MTVRDGGQRGRSDMEVWFQIRESTGNGRAKDEDTHKGNRQA